MYNAAPGEMRKKKQAVKTQAAEKEANNTHKKTMAAGNSKDRGETWKKKYDKKRCFYWHDMNYADNLTKMEEKTGQNYDSELPPLHSLKKYLLYIRKVLLLISLKHATEDH